MPACKQFTAPTALGAREGEGYDTSAGETATRVHRLAPCSKSHSLATFAQLIPRSSLLLLLLNVLWGKYGSCKCAEKRLAQKIPRQVLMYLNQTADQPATNAALLGFLSLSAYPLTVSQRIFNVWPRLCTQILE